MTDAATLYLHLDTFICRVGPGAVILDLPRHKYLAVSARHLRCLQDNVVGFSEPGQASIPRAPVASHECEPFLGQLLERGLLVRCPELGKPAGVSHIEPRRSLQGVIDLTRRSAPTIRDMRIITQAYAMTALTLRRGGLLTLVQRLRDLKDSNNRQFRPTDSADFTYLSSVFSGFKRCRIWLYTPYDRCLLDSIVLANFLLQHGLPAQLTIGVGISPFIAHAWVQVVDLALDERVEKIQRYVPILWV